MINWIYKEAKKGENKMNYICPKANKCNSKSCNHKTEHPQNQGCGDIMGSECPQCVEVKKKNKLDILKRKFNEFGAEIEKLEKEEEKSKDDYVSKIR